MKIQLTEEIWQEGNMYVSYCPELDVSSCGKNVWQAKHNLIEAIEINIDEARRLGTLERFFEENGIEQIGQNVMGVGKQIVGFRPIEVAV